jgi:hypothetical protein
MSKQNRVQVIDSLFFAGCLSCSSVAQSSAKATASEKVSNSGYLGFDRNVYPGDQTLPIVAKRFSFVGYWLSSPPLEQSNTWIGKRSLISSHNLGFLVLWNGRLDKEILDKVKGGTTATALGANDAHAAILAAKREGFPAGTIRNEVGD